MQAFRSFGGAKAGADKKILEEVQAMIQSIKNQSKSPVDVASVTLKLTGNVISNILFSESFGYEDEGGITELVDLSKGWYDGVNTLGLSSMFLPDWLLPILRAKQVQAYADATANLEKYIERQVK